MMVSELPVFILSHKLFYLTFSPDPAEESE